VRQNGMMGKVGGGFVQFVKFVKFVEGSFPCDNGNGKTCLYAFYELYESVVQSSGVAVFVERNGA